MLAFRIRMQPPFFSLRAKQLSYWLDVDAQGSAMLSAATPPSSTAADCQQWLGVEPNFIWRTPWWIMIRWRLCYPAHRNFLRGDLARAWRSHLPWAAWRSELVCFAWCRDHHWQALQRWVSWCVRRHQPVSSSSDLSLQASPHG